MFSSNLHAASDKTTWKWPHKTTWKWPHDKADHGDTTTKRVFDKLKIGGYYEILSDIAHIWTDTNILFKGYVRPVIKPHHIHSYSRIEHIWPPHYIWCPFLLPLGHNSWTVCSYWEWHSLLPYSVILSDLTIGDGPHIEWCKLNLCANIWWTKISYLVGFGKQKAFLVLCRCLIQSSWTADQCKQYDQHYILQASTDAHCTLVLHYFMLAYN